MSHKAVIVTIGDELLIGQTIDTNSAWIAQQLNAIGVGVHSRIATGDNAPDIRQSLDRALSDAQLVIVTGGLGPTSDDITKPLLCDYFGGTLVVNKEVEKHVRAIFSSRNRPILDVNLKQAEVPDNCTVLRNRMGTAPGMLFRKDGKLVVSLPGVPYEMQTIMEEEALPLIRDAFQGMPVLHSTILTAGAGESFIAERIRHIEKSLPPHIKLAYLPHPGLVRLRLTSVSTDPGQGRELSRWSSKLSEEITDLVIAHEDVSLEQALSKLLLHRGQTLSTAESCTGGYIAHRITGIPGASELFLGSVVSYADEIKSRVLMVSPDTVREQGAVSEAVVTDMARNGRLLLQSDYCIAVSGILGPGGGSEEKPVGTTWMAVAGPNGIVAERHRFHYDRPRNKELAANYALAMAFRYIRNDRP